MQISHDRGSITMRRISGFPDSYHCSDLSLKLTLSYQFRIMNIKVIEDDILRNIQNDFSKQYPFLKLEFYKCSHPEYVGSPESERLSADLPLEEATAFHCSGMIDISSLRTVAEVEHDFLKRLGLSVQIFRRSGQLWIETTETDHWSLEQQNAKGCEYSMPYKQDPPPDFNLIDFN